MRHHRTGLVGVRPPFTPIDLASLKLWLRPGAGVYQDDGLTTPVTADGDPVGGWKDQSGGNNHVYQATAGNRPEYKVDPYLGAFLKFVKASDKFLRGATPALAQPFTGFLIARSEFVGGATASAMLDSGSAFNTLKFFCGTDSIPGQWAMYAGAQLAVGIWGSFNWQIISFLMDGVSSTITVDRQIGSQAGNPNVSGDVGAAAGSGVTIGQDGLGFSSEPWSGGLAELAICDGVLSGADTAKMLAYLRAKMPPALIFVGDSITFGSQSTAMQTSFAGVTALNFGGACTATDLGVGGKTMAQMAADAPVQAALYPISTRTNNVVVIFGGTNDIATGSSAADTYTSLLLCVVIWITAGCKVVVVTMLPRGAPYEVERVAYNTLIRNGAVANGYVVADVASDLNMGQAGQNTDLTYYNVDTVHPNDTGHSIIANSYVIPAITWL